jgi:hypothetical protein
MITKRILGLFLILLMAACVDGAEELALEPTAVAEAESQTIEMPLWRSRTDRGRCVGTADGGSMANYTRLVVWDCHGFHDQQWRLHDDGQLKSPWSGKCIGTANGGSMENYTALVVWDCNGNADQRWRLTANGELQNVYSGKCVGTANGGSMVNYTHLVVWDCNGNGDQKWEFSYTRPTLDVSTQYHAMGGWVTLTGTASSDATINVYAYGLRGRTQPLSLGTVRTDAAGRFSRTLDLRCWPYQTEPVTIHITDPRVNGWGASGQTYAYSCG